MTAVAIARADVATVAAPLRPAALRRKAYTAPTPHMPAPHTDASLQYRTRAPLGDPTPLVCTVAKAALEVAHGADGIDPLTRWITPTLRTVLLRQQSLSRRANYAPRGSVTVVRVRLCRVSASAVEAAVVITEGDVAHAIAMRLETVAGRWLITALDIG